MSNLESERELRKAVEKLSGVLTDDVWDSIKPNWPPPYARSNAKEFAGKVIRQDERDAAAAKIRDSYGLDFSWLAMTLSRCFGSFQIPVPEDPHDRIEMRPMGVLLAALLDIHEFARAHNLPAATAMRLVFGEPGIFSSHYWASDDYLASLLTEPLKSLSRTRSEMGKGAKKMDRWLDLLGADSFSRRNIRREGLPVTWQHRWEFYEACIPETMDRYQTKHAYRVAVRRAQKEVAKYGTPEMTAVILGEQPHPIWEEIRVHLA